MVKKIIKKRIPFQFQIPPYILNPRTKQQAIQEGLESKLGGAESLISAVAVRLGNTKWKIRAQSDVSKALDVIADQDIQLYSKKGNQPGGVV